MLKLLHKLSLLNNVKNDQAFYLTYIKYSMFESINISIDFHSFHYYYEGWQGIKEVVDTVGINTYAVGAKTDIKLGEKQQKIWDDGKDATVFQMFVFYIYHLSCYSCS